MPILLIALIAIVVLFVLGWLVVGLALKLLWWALVGLVIGALARLILPGKQEISLLATAGTGVAAGLLGGLIANVLDLGTLLQFVVVVIVAVALVAAVSGSRLARA
ncbi:MAG TPA: hypothetical protein VEY87_08955 [Gaiellaceae bacterium]|jgi:uncharacterized membrane protein YeaQ/YmgE (transglycosylase-associated protein family)|nr:hypothetical protein [Gaiellaceae bacterium]